MPAARVRSRWADLQPDLLGLVLSRVPSHADRVRLRAVCRAWRSGARTVQHLLPPLLPLAALRDGSFLSLPDGAVHRMPIPEDISRRLSTGGMLFLLPSDGRCSMMHPQSGDAAPREIWMTLPSLRHYEVRKVVVADHFVAVQTSMYLTVYGRGRAEPVGVKRLRPETSRGAADMALFKGKLYVLTADSTINHDYGLYVLDITSNNKQGGISVTSVQCISGRQIIPRDHSIKCCYQYRFYLVVSGDRLLVVDQTINRSYLDRARMPSRFLVWEAVDLDGQARWSKVDTLMGRALFVSEGCSGSLPAVRGGVREDCIYFLSECYTGSHNYDDMELESGVYNMREGTVESLLPPLKASAARTASDVPCPPTWLFPVGT